MTRQTHCPLCHGTGRVIPRRPLTRKQLAIADYMRGFHQESGVWPTLVEIGTHFGKSLATVHEHITALERKGYVCRDRDLEGRAGTRCTRLVDVAA